jgi:hypothetical protein
MAVPANPVNWERTMTHAARDRRRDRVVPGLVGGNARHWVDMPDRRRLNQEGTP